MFKHRRQNSLTARKEKLYNEINTLILDCYKNDNMRVLEKIITDLRDSSARAEILLHELEKDMCVRDFCEYCDYCRR